MKIQDRGHEDDQAQPWSPVFMLLCLFPGVLLILPPGASAPGQAPGLLITGLAIFVLSWARWRSNRLEVTETMVRSRPGWPLVDKEVARSDITAIHRFDFTINFIGPDGHRDVIALLNHWTLRQMIEVADELNVPLYQHRLGNKTGQLMNHPATPAQPLGGTPDRPVPGFN